MRSRRHAHHESEACVKQDTPSNIAAEGAAGSSAPAARAARSPSHWQPYYTASGRVRLGPGVGLQARLSCRRLLCETCHCHCHCHWHLPAVLRLQNNGRPTCGGWGPGPSHWHGHGGPSVGPGLRRYGACHLRQPGGSHWHPGRCQCYCESALFGVPERARRRRPGKTLSSPANLIRSIMPVRPFAFELRPDSEVNSTVK